MSDQKWRIAYQELVEEQLSPLLRLDDGVIWRDKKSAQQVMILKHNGMILMYFYSTQSDVVQSRMILHSPFYLMAPYSQLSMTALSMCPAAKRICVIGLGGGRIPMLLRYLLPDTVIDCCELDPAVVYAAERFFGFLQDERMQAHVGDGRAFLEAHDAKKPYDIIFLDAFDDSMDGPLLFATAEFFSMCRKKLSKNGVVVINLLPGDSRLKQKKATVLASFPYVYALEDAERGNIVLFACESAHAREQMRDYGMALEAEVNLGFSMCHQIEMLANASAASFLASQPHQEAILRDVMGASDAKTVAVKLSRNDVCYCGSGKKYKKCHGA